MSDERAGMGEQQTKRWLVYLDGREAPIVVKADRFSQARSTREGLNSDEALLFFVGSEVVAKFAAESEPSVIATEAHV